MFFATGKAAYSGNARGVRPVCRKAPGAGACFCDEHLPRPKHGVGIHQGWCVNLRIKGLPTGARFWRAHLPGVKHGFMHFFADVTNVGPLHLRIVTEVRAEHPVKLWRARTGSAIAPNRRPAERSSTQLTPLQAKSALTRTISQLTARSLKSRLQARAGRRS